MNDFNLHARLAIGQIVLLWFVIDTAHFLNYCPLVFRFASKAEFPEPGVPRKLAESSQKTHKEVPSMKRRSFLAGAVAVGFATPRSLNVFSVNDPCISRLRADNLPTVGDKNDRGGLDNQTINVDVCEMNFEEDDKVLFHFRVTNTGNNDIQIFHCQPFAANSWKRIERFGPFARVNAHDFFKAGTQAQGGWRADNDSNAFYAEVKIAGNWQRMGQLTQIRTSPDDKVAHMEWHQPHEVRFEVWAVDNR